VTPTQRLHRLLEPRLLHPGAWWLWALALAAAATRTTNPVVLLAVVAAAGTVVAARRSTAPWSRSFVAFVVAGGVLLVVRMAFAALVMDTAPGGTVLVRLPEVALPGWLAGVRLGGAVTAEGLLFALYQGLQLLAVLACVGAANALADPRRLLRSVPGAFYEVGVSLVVALTYAPRLVEDAVRVRAAQRLRGRPQPGLRGLARTAVPVLEGGLASSLDLAAAMDSRGFARAGDVPVRFRRATGLLVLAGLVGVAVGLFGLLGGNTLPASGAPVVALGVALALVGALLAGRRSRRTRYRPDPWTLPEWATVVCGLAAATVVLLAAARWPAAMDPVGRVPLVVPAAPWPVLAGLLVAAAPAVLTPAPPLPAAALRRPVGAVPAGAGA
jgi:energy-coupling factor transport system permease protein